MFSCETDSSRFNSVVRVCGCGLLRSLLIEQSTDQVPPDFQWLVFDFKHNSKVSTISYCVFNSNFYHELWPFWLVITTFSPLTFCMLKVYGFVNIWTIYLPFQFILLEFQVFLTHHILPVFWGNFWNVLWRLPLSTPQMNRPY